jgi:hypothetical protein
MVQEAVSQMLFMGQVGCNNDSRIQLLWAELVSLLENHCQWIDMYGEGLIKAQHVRKWSKEFENGQTDIHDDIQVSPAHQGWM